MRQSPSVARARLSREKLLRDDDLVVDAMVI